MMRRHSEIPNTPTPFSKVTNELKIGSMLSIPNTGRAILKYIGPVQGKGGRFAGIELLGESAILGKNNGDVNGVQYFKTSKSGSGLFMTYDKLLQSIDFVESPSVSKRLSLIGSPFASNKKLETNRRHTATALTPSSLASVRNSTSKASHTRSNSSTPPGQMVIKDSPSSEEFKRAIRAKASLETEKNSLIHKTEALKYEVEDLQNRLEDQQKIIKDLEITRNQDKTKLEKANEKVTIIENKLHKQKAAFEEQRNELLDVIEQLESQVNDNEKLYFGELKKLQEEITQKEISLTSNAANGSESSNIIKELQEKLNILQSDKTEKETFVVDLQTKVEDLESKLLHVNKESLDLKEAIISDKTKYDNELKDLKDKLNEMREEVAVRDKVIEKLRGEIKTITSKNDTKSVINDTENLEKEIRDLKTQLEAKHKDILQFTETQKELEELKKSSPENSSADKITELEFKLDNKESIINSLKSQLASSLESGNDEGVTREANETISKLQDQLKQQEKLVEDKQRISEEVEKLKEVSQSLRDVVTEKEKQILEYQTNISTLKESKSSDDQLESALSLKEKELKSMKETMQDLQIQLKELKLVEQKKSVIETERANLSDSLKEKKFQISTLNKKVDELNQKLKEQTDNSDYKSLLEEKSLEIELLKEELLLAKSTEHFKEVEALKEEISSLKELNKSTTNSELNNQLRILQAELKRRPAASQVEELRSELELIDELRKVESRNKDKEIEKLKKLLSEFGSTLKENKNLIKTPSPRNEKKTTPISINKENKETKVDGARTKVSKEPQSNRATMSNISLNRPPVISQVVDGALQVYVPEEKVDPANGRKLWCGLCEREGHDSIDCPYENDIF
ncbi:Laminin-like protein epi-1 [Wickerhamomyces ciferrii]|uniref:Laminin-like protein epi-1 n=1 Tax=Wickerhamomyces ciferrii (strain ATCC 14091 / BCRC 22168 / CBS 111 / JCM 3599 / NBRC 0793 / NRRL Y-1031 F-60-10) TaxID=1206466 RepID=K0KTF4_WICCF|nr:Laminin-like protein epi-1 [Wickerhamomyces ciferrii]CCH46446.1 Laminin-like protein epi-1 [Wickerhamomyces ciferrii]